jgi:hypothetical protein
MKPDSRVLVSLLLIVSLTLPAASLVHARAAAPAAGPPAASVPMHAPPAVDRAAILESFGRMPLYFVENQGQMDSQVAYYVQGSDKTIYFTPDGVTFALTAPVQRAGEETAQIQRDRGLPSRLPDPAAEPPPTSRWAVRLEFVGANPEARPVGEEQTGAIISYFKGPREEWHAGLPTYSRIVYRDLWPGIDLVYYGTSDRLKYDFIVQPGADPEQIRLAYHGATSVELTGDGQLQISTPAGGFADDAPVAYQEVGGRRVPVAMAYVLEDLTPGPPGLPVRAGSPAGRGESSSVTSQAAAEAAALTSRAYTFTLGDYDPALPLVLDPAILVYCGYVGGSDADDARAIAVDGAGNAYVTGYTNSSEATFPVTVGPDLTYNGGDAFVVKVRADGSGLAYAGYIGGSDFDVGVGIAVDEAGNAYITGYTTSNQATFPVVEGPDLTYNGGYDAFVAEVLADGTSMAYSGYIGGSGWDFGQGIAVDSAGNAYVTGFTDSTEVTFPVAVGPDLTHNGNRDAFVAKVSANGAGLAYAGYIGGSGWDEAYAIAVDGAANVYVAGETASSEATFPVAVGPDLTHNGGGDAFVAKVRADGTGLVYAGYIGGSGFERGYGIAVDGGGQCLHRGAHFVHRSHLPGGHGTGLDLQWRRRLRQRRLRGQGAGRRHGSGLRRLHRRQRW